MVYDEQPGPPVHLTLPLPDVKALARGQRKPPSRRVRDTIVQVTRAALQRSPGTSIDPYRLHADLLTVLPDVTIGEVAWVLLTSFEVAR